MIPVAIMVAIAAMMLGTGGGVSPIAVGLLALFVAFVVPRLNLASHGPWARLPWLAPVPAAAVAAPTAWRATVVTRSASSVRTTTMLALAESKRLVLSPMFGVGLAFIVVTTYQVRDNSAVSVYNALANAGPMAYVFGPLVLFAANAIASSSRFDDTEQLFGVAPVSASRRTLALCLAGIPAAVVALAVQYAALLLFRSVWHLHLTYTPSTWVMLATPLEVMGAVCLGVMIARWLPWRGAVIPAFLFVAVAVTFATGDALKGTRWLAPVLEFVRTDEGRATPVWLVGSAAWHAGYLLALAGMATVGAMLRVASRRTGLLGVGAVVTLAAIGAGWTQVG